MSDLSVKSTRRKFQGDFHHGLNDTPDPVLMGADQLYQVDTPLVIENLLEFPLADLFAHR